MKRIIFIIFLAFISLNCFSQNTKKENEKDVVVSINVSKISKGLGKIIKITLDEIHLYRDEIKENLIEPNQEKIDSIKVTAKAQIKDIHKKVHEGFAAGLRGETYP